jgi:hypothetical protein
MPVIFLPVRHGFTAPRRYDAMFNLKSAEYRETVVAISR